MEEKVMALVKEITDGKSISCRGLDKAYLARKLMNLANIPQNAEIKEIPIYWNNIVIIYFLLPENDNYYILIAGTFAGDFYFDLFIMDKLLNNCHTIHLFESFSNQLLAFQKLIRSIVEE